jgi:uncharacterized cupredoxin-like copper-binding protein
VLLAALSTGHKLGLGLVGLAFVVFALVSAFLIPRFRPDYPGRRGLAAFLTLTTALFVGMMFAVFFFGREAEEAGAEGGSTSAETTEAAPTTSETQTSNAQTTTAASAQTVDVTETEFKIALSSTDLKAGSYEFDVSNEGQAPHDLVVEGPGVDDQKTPVIDGGKTTTLKVDLKSGTYELYCSVPGHKEAGMDVKVKVS